MQYTPPLLTDDSAAELLAAIERSLPSHLPHEAREDARQSIIVDILEGKALPADIPARLLRRRVTQARGMSQTKFGFVSLDELVIGGDGRAMGTRADRLAA